MNSFYYTFNQLIDENGPALTQLVNDYKSSITDIAEGIIKLSPFKNHYEATKSGINCALKCYKLLSSKGKITQKDIEQVTKLASSHKLQTNKFSKQAVNEQKKMPTTDHILPNIPTTSSLINSVARHSLNYLYSGLGTFITQAKESLTAVLQIKKGIEGVFDVRTMRQVQKSDKIAIELIHEEVTKKLKKTSSRKDYQKIKKSHIHAVNIIRTHTEQRKKMKR